MAMQYLGGAVGHHSLPAALHLFQLPPDHEQGTDNSEPAETTIASVADVNGTNNSEDTNNNDDDRESCIYSDDEIQDTDDY
jgi:hypothetical protein